jgi:hypothetical protein
MRFGRLIIHQRSRRLNISQSNSASKPVTVHFDAEGNMLPLHLFILPCALPLATPSFAARCSGDFNSFVARMSAEAQAAVVS